jgi:hypothetical protein
MEQLIPPSLLAEYGISTQTPLRDLPLADPPTKVIMEVPETESAIRAALIALGEKPMICQEKGKREKKEMTENKRKLQKIADIAGKKLVYVKDPSITLASLVTVAKTGGKKAAET